MYNKEDYQVIYAQRTVLCTYAELYMSNKMQSIETDVPLEFFHTADEKCEYGVFIEVFYNEDMCPDGCFDLTFCYATKDKDDHIEFFDNIDSIPCSIQLIQEIIRAESMDEIEKVMLRELNRYFTIEASQENEVDK